MTPTKDAPRVVRGGGWISDGASSVRAASRYTLVPAGRYDSIGFRCALRGRQPR